MSMRGWAYRMGGSKIAGRYPKFEFRLLQRRISCEPDVDDRLRAGVLVVGADPLFFTRRGQLVALQPRGPDKAARGSMTCLPARECRDFRWELHQ
jgi:hypothetical protein